MEEAITKLSAMDPSDDMGKVLECILEIIEHVEGDPSSGDSGEALRMVHEKEKASREYFMRPFDSDEIYNRLMAVHNVRGEEGIASEYTRCLDLRQARKWTILGDSYALMGLNKRASGYLKKALYFGPSEDLVEAVQRTYEKALKRVVKAEEGAESSLYKAEKDPGNIKNLIKALGYLLDLDRLDETLELADVGLKRHGDDFEILYRKGVALFGKDQFDPALEVFNRTLDMRPTSANAKRAVNLSQEMLGNVV